MENNNKNRELFSIFPKLELEWFEKKIKKSMEPSLHANSNVISMNFLTPLSLMLWKFLSLGKLVFMKKNLFSSPALRKKVCSYDTLSTICGNSNDTCDILN